MDKWARNFARNFETDVKIVRPKLMRRCPDCSPFSEMEFVAQPLDEEDPVPPALALGSWICPCCGWESVLEPVDPMAYADRVAQRAHDIWVMENS